MITQEESERIVQQFEEQYAARFCRRDVAAFITLFTEDATALSEWGDVMNGRDEFARALTRAFANMPGELAVKLQPTHVRPLCEDVIVSHGKACKSLAGEVETLYYTRVLIRQNGEWRLAATQVAPASALPDPRR